MIRNIFTYFCLFVFGGCAAAAPKSFHGLDGSVRQVIWVHPLRPRSSQAILSAWQRQKDSWRRVYLMSAVLGKNGMASGGDKREGDGRTPAGVYPLGPAFGYAPRLDTGLDFRQATPNDFWVDDPQSVQYNQWVTGTPAARSFERLRRKDGLYQYGVVIGYNRHPVVPGAGSAIFMHVWRGYNRPTAGCVALNQRNLRRVLRWLDRRKGPEILLENT